MRKICTKCGKEKSIDEFYKNKSRQDEHSCWCKSCTNDFFREQHQTVTYKTKKQMYAKKYHSSEKGKITRICYDYNLTRQQYSDLIESANGKCQICKRPCEKFFIDHDHSTGKVRGLLCSNCNAVLGFSGDNALILTQAAEYLRKAAEAHAE